MPSKSICSMRFLRSNTSQQQEVSQVCLRKQGLSVLSTSLWSEHSPSDLYSSGAYCDRLPPSSGDFSYPLPRRLVRAPSRWSSVTQPPVSATRYAITGGVYTKREKVRIGPCPGYPVLGSSVAPGSGESSPPRFQGSRDCSSDTRVTISKNPVISEVGPIHGLTKLGLRSYPSGSLVPEAVTTTFSFSRSVGPVFSTASIRPAAPCQRTPSVAGPIFSYIRYPHLPFYDLQGSFYLGVGRPHGGFPNFGYLDPLGPQTPHQLFGAQGGSLGPAPLEYSASGPPGFDRYRQYNSSLLHQQAIRDPFPVFVTSSSRSFHVATDSGHSPQSQTHPRLLECDSELKSEVRTESEVRNCQSDFPVLGDSRSGHVRVSPQHPSTSVCVSSSGATSTGGGCSVTRLAGEIDVHVSPDPSAQQDHSENYRSPKQQK